MLCSCSWSANPVAVVTVQGKTITDGHITVDKGETVCFNGTGSSDPDGDSLTYLWSFGEGDTSADAKPCHTYRTAGSFPVKLKVGDVRPEYPLLTGKTPSNYTLPSGWTLVRTQDFETGALGYREALGGSINTVNPHTGNYSAESTVKKDDPVLGWSLAQGEITTGEVYISFWQYFQPQAINNEEVMFCNFRKNLSGGQYQTVRWQYLNNLNAWDSSFNITHGNLILFCEGNATGSPPSHAYYKKAVWQPFGSGVWRQWEIYFKANTPNVQNGNTRIYMNGRFVTEVKDTAFAGGVDMSGPIVVLGGPTYTKIEWGSKKSGGCAQAKNELDFSLSRPSSFTEPCLCPGQCPPDGYVPVFKIYVDDIIILQR